MITCHMEEHRRFWKSEVIYHVLYYDSKLLELGQEVILYGGNIRELDRELCTGLSTLYTKGAWSMLGLSNLP